ncbi:MAG: hypothetical protein K2K89_01680 [Ruminococcus sp.]|nr:hypothetical protein [Ruminococcus sp.]
MLNNEILRNYQQPEMPRNASAVHQTVVICIDTSGFMNDSAEDGRKNLRLLRK